jgi:aminoglycoside 2'-N-acetyltransferase I
LTYPTQPVRIVSYPQLALPADLRAQSLALQHQAWPGDHDEAHPEHDPALHPVSVLLVDGAIVIACLDILSKQIAHHGQSFLASGLSMVVTDEAKRGRGHGRRLVAAERELIAGRGADLGIFTCDRPLAGFYESAGWQLLLETVLIGGTRTARSLAISSTRSRWSTSSPIMLAGTPKPSTTRGSRSTRATSTNCGSREPVCALAPVRGCRSERDHSCVASAA